MADADVLETARRQPLQIDREDDDRHQPEPEGRHRIEDEAKRRDKRVRPPVDAARGDHAEDQPEEEGERERGRHQQDRRRQPLRDHGRDGLAIDRREAEIEPDQPPEIIAELGPDREVEAVELAQLAAVAASPPPICAIIASTVSPGANCSSRNTPIRIRIRVGIEAASRRPASVRMRMMIGRRDGSGERKVTPPTKDRARSWSPSAACWSGCGPWR